MPRAPNPQVSKARKLYEDGHKLTEIAAMLGLPDGTVRRWKSTYKWDSERSESKTSVRNRGGQPGNKNAVGNRGGAPQGNRNNYRHGFFIDVLSKEEQAMIEQRGVISEEQHLINQIHLLEIRERHLLRHIEDQRAVASGLAVRSVTRSDENVVKLVNTLENIKDLEDKLTRVQQTYVRYVELLHRIHREDGGEGDNSMNALINIFDAARKGDCG